MASEFLNKIITAVFPDRCLCCGSVVRPGQLCCAACEESLPLRKEKCLPAEQGQPFLFLAAPFEYRDGVRRAILQMKFYGHKEAADLFVPYMLAALREYSPDWVVPVPMADYRRAERGYNQAELLAEPIAQKISAEYHPRVLVRTGTVAQHDLSARLRRLEAQNSFELAPNASPDGKRILLVDDVFTTGSTMRRCAWLLKDAGAAEVACLTAALSPKNDN